MRKLLLYFTASILVGAALVFNTSAQSEKQASQTISRATMDDYGLKLLTKYIKFRGHDDTFFVGEFFTGQQISLYFNMVNENNKSFEGQYGFAMFSKADIIKEGYNYDELQVVASKIIYESPVITVAKGDSILTNIKTSPLPSSNEFRGEMSVFPIFKEKGGEWKTSTVDRPGYSAGIYIRYTDFILNSEITSSSTKLTPNEEFEITAFVVDNRDETENEEIKIGLFYEVRTPERMITTPSIRYNFTESIDSRREGNKFYCKIPDNIPSGQYFLKVYSTKKMDYGTVSVFPIEDRQVYYLDRFENELKIELKNDEIENEFYNAHFYSDYLYNQPVTYHEYYPGSGLRKNVLSLYTSSAGVETEGQWGIAISKKSGYDDIDPDTDLLILYGSETMTLLPNRSYTMDKPVTDIIPFEYANSTAYLRPVFRKNSSEKWKLTTRLSFPITVLDEATHLIDYVETPANLDTIYQDQVLEIYAPIYKPSGQENNYEYAVGYFKNYYSDNTPLFVMEGTYKNDVFRVKLPSNANHITSLRNGIAIVYRENGGEWSKMPTTNNIEYNGKEHTLSTETVSHNLILTQSLTIASQTAYSSNTFSTNDKMIVNAIYSNLGDSIFNGKIAVLIEKGIESYIIGQIDITNLALHRIRTIQIECSLPTNASDGNYQLSIIARSNSSDEWQEVLQETSEVQSHTEVSVRSVTGIEDAENDQTFSVYPNPVVDVLNIKSERSMQSVELYNLSGSMLMKQNNAGNEQTIQMNEYPNGLYIVRIKTDNGTTVKKVKKN